LPRRGGPGRCVAHSPCFGVALRSTCANAFDLTHDKRLEIEALHGHAVRHGERHGIPTRMLFAVYAALKP